MKTSTRTQQFLSKMNHSHPNFYPLRHDYTNKVLLGRLIRGSGPDEVRQILDILAYHPATAKHISYKLAQYFISDKPSDQLVSYLSSVYLETHGNIRSILYALFTSQDFWALENRNNKFKTPYQYLISTIRASGASINNYRYLLFTLNDMGMPLYGHITPDGYPNTKEAWLDSDAMVKRVNFAVQFANSKQINNQNGFEKSYQAYLPQLNEKTKYRIKASPVQLKTALILGSPEAMMH